jgi:UDP-glucose 4-epimerase
VDAGEDSVRICVTGAAGYVGSVLTIRAAEQGHEVLALDDLSRGLNHPWLFGPHSHAAPDGLPSRTCERIIAMQHDCRGGFVEALRSDRTRDARGLRHGDLDRPIDAVVHLAAGTGSLDRPIEELRGLNVEMTKRVWQDAKDLGAKVFVFPTTSLALAVPDSPYVRSKEEAMTWLLAQTDGPRKVGLRFFNVAGSYKGRTEKRKHEVHLIPAMVQHYQAGEPLVINGNDYPETEDGTPGRDFVNVLDVADAILVLLDEPHHGVAAQNDGAIWLGTHHLTSARQVVSIFEQWVGPLETNIGPRRAFDCGALYCPPEAMRQFARLIGRPPAPAWVSVRDEVLELLR